MRRAAACLIAFLPAISLAQTSQPVGLDALSDQRLIAELSSRGLNSLLDRAFDVNNVPPTQRDAMRSLIALKQLGDPNVKLSAAQRQAAVQKAVAGIEVALSSLSDPQIMMNQANALTQYGVELDVNTLEYWGENPKTQAAMRPVVGAVVKLLDKAAAEAQKQADLIANTISGPNDPRATQWENLAGVANLAQYNRRMIDYYVALSMDHADAKRKQIAADAIKFLAQYDNADSTVQAGVRNRIAKLHMARGDYENAREVFGTVIEAKDIQPPPDTAQQWEARYFTAQSDLLAGKIEAAQKGLDDLIKWQAQKLPNDSGATALDQMLQYRIYSAQSEKGDKQANEKAVATLIDLLKKRPGLQAIIFEQLMSKLPADADLGALDPLLLQGFIVRADQERQLPDDQKPDAKVLQRGIDAAKEMLRRKNAVDPQFADSASLLVGFFNERLDRHAEAAEAFLDYLKNFPTATQEHQQIALDSAQSIIAKLRANPATVDQPATVHAYERFLPVAIGPPFNRTGFAYEYARRLMANNKFADAVKYFRQVPPDDKRYAFARFYLMDSLEKRLDDEKIAPAERKQVVADILGLVDDVTTRLNAVLAAAKTDNERNQARSMLVRTVLAAADIARREQNDPARTLKLLESFESIAQGLPDAQELVIHVLYTRVQAYMALGDSTSATAALVTLLKTRPGGEGAKLASRILEKLNHELDAARATGDRAKMQSLAKNRAALSGFLVDWARSNSDPNIKKFTYRYMVFDAATKHLAADLTDDPAARSAGLKAALALYRQLESPQSVELYRATLDLKSTERESDPAVALGIGLISYDLGDYAEAQQRLGHLLTNRKLGTPSSTIEEDGQLKTVENDQYWEATIRLMRSNIALAGANVGDAKAQAAKQETINYLKQLYIRYGREVGGRKWAGEFENLRREVAPDFNPDEYALQAATQPAAPAK
jgi:tetratricopeptide (TPR) repeat protein